MVLRFGLDVVVLKMCNKGLADFQYQPDMSDPVVKLRLAMDNMDGMSQAFCETRLAWVTSDV